MAFPVATFNRSALLLGETNGELDPGILESTPGQAGGPTVTLVRPAARAWRALCAAALKAGHTLKASGAASSYRTYAEQERLFRQRFTTSPVSGTVRLWNGVRWYLRPGVALAAVPGTSNHGWGSAVDTGEERDGDSGTESIDAGTLAWLVDNEGRFGFSHEVQSEPWHIRYNAGDRIPNAVLLYEQSLTEKPKPAPVIEFEEPSMFVAYVAQTKRYYSSNAGHVEGLTKDEATALTSAVGGFRMHVFNTDALWRKVHGK
jgi:hypothetical protein